MLAMSMRMRRGRAADQGSAADQPGDLLTVACQRSGRSTSTLTLGLLMLVGLPACDFEVVNPGPVEDQFLDPPEAHAGLVVGAKRALGEALGDVAYFTSGVSRENFAGGGSGGPFAYVSQLGQVSDFDVSSEWNSIHSARWAAEDAVRRMTQVLGEEAAGSDQNVLEANVWAGVANGLLGDLFCEAVIDGGAREPSQVHWDRAEQQFTRAIAIAQRTGDDQFRLAALAGRASVRVMLGKWGDAVADADAVPRDFVFAMPYSNEATETYNHFALYNDNSPWRRHTVAGTFFEEYFRDTNDARTTWETFSEWPISEILDLPWLAETKYGPFGGANWIKSITIHTGLEMRLIIAEGRLRAGDRDAALAIINERRAELGVPLRTASSDDEAWTALKLERFIEMWLEGRALADHRRYAAENTPGPLPDTWDMTDRALCLPVAESEILTNRNVS